MDGRKEKMDKDIDRLMVGLINGWTGIDGQVDRRVD